MEEKGDDAGNVGGLTLFNSIARGAGNVWMSPVSINSALSMAAMGASDGTNSLQQCLSILGAGSKEELITHAGALQEMVGAANMEGLELLMANGIFSKGGIKEGYITDLTKHFNAAALPLEGAGQVNEWIAEQTMGHITDVLEDPLDAALVLVNAMYFKGDWDTGFKISSTYPSFFYPSGRPAGGLDCAMMSQKDVFDYYHDTEHGVQYVMKPYKNTEYAAIFALPDEEGGLPTVMELASDANYFQSMGKNLKGKTLVLEVPRFKLKVSTDLIPHMQSAGLTAPFNESCEDLKGMSDEPLYFNQALHVATLEVTESGTIAAAVTVMTCTYRGAGPPPHRVTLDRPFLMSIVHTPTMTPLFMGAVKQPDLLPLPEGASKHALSYGGMFDFDEDEETDESWRE